MDNNIAPLNILFTQSSPCMRNYKMAKALRSRGHRVSLAYIKKPLSQMYPGLSDKAYDECIRLNSYRQLWDISSHFDVVHCHNESDTLSVAALACSAPVVHDTHDLNSLRDYEDPALSYYEGVANRGANGRVYSTPNQLEEAKKLYDIGEPNIVFYNYASESHLTKRFLPKLSRGDGDIHIVYAGEAGAQVHRNLAELFIELASRDVQIHIFPGAFSKEQVKYFSNCSRIHYYQPVSSYNLIETMTQFDYGIIPFNIENGNKKFLDSTVSYRLFEYLAAGLPVITSSLKSYIDFFSKNPVGMVFDCVDEILCNRPRLYEISKNTDFTSQIYTYESEIDNLVLFYRELKTSQQRFLTIRSSEWSRKDDCRICRDRQIESITEIDSHTLIHCDNCQTYYVEPMPSDAFLRAWYSEEEKKKRWGSDLSLAIEANHRNNEGVFNHYFEFFSKNIQLNRPAKILEVGCYDGFFLKMFSDSGYECKGIDLNEGFVKYGRNQYGLDLECGTIFDCGFADQSFDLVVFHQVLEHLNDPIAFLNEVFRVTKEDGFVFLSAPNTGALVHKAELSFINGKRKPRFVDFPNHLFYFSKNSLEFLLNDTGFKDPIIRTFSNSGDPENVLKKLGADDATIATNRNQLLSDPNICDWQKIKPYISKIVLNAIHKEAAALNDKLDIAPGLLAIARKRSTQTHYKKTYLSDQAAKGSELPAQQEDIPKELIIGETAHRQLLNLELTQWLPLENLRRIQNTFLSKLITEAYHKVPFYKKTLDEYDIRPELVRSIEDLKKLPVINKDILQANYDDFFNSDLHKLDNHFTATGGSTGKTLKYSVSPEVYYYGFGCRNRGFRWAGFDVEKDKVAYFAGGSLGLTDSIEIDKNKLKIPVTGITSKEVMSNYYEALKDFRPKYMRAYPSALYQFCIFLRETNKTLKLKSIVTTAETLYDHQRKLIEEVLCGSIFNEYGAYDGGAGAFECAEHNGLHLQMERGIIEILDENGNEVRAGQTGRVIVTDLHNYIFPFIRYDVGDHVVATDHQCSCGRGLQLIQEIKGRSSDYIILGDGAKLSGEVIIHLFNKLLQENRIDISRYQVIQKTEGAILILVIPGRNYRPKNLTTIKNIFETHLKGLQINVEAVSELISTPAGKTRFVYSEIKTAKIVPTRIIVRPEKEKPKIGHIGGAHSVHVADIVFELDQRGYEQFVISYFPEDQSITPSHIPVYSFPYTRYENAEWREQNIQSILTQFLGRVYAKEKPDLIQGHSLTYSCIPLWATKSEFNLKTLLLPWSINTMLNPNPIANYYEKKCLSNLDKFLYPSPQGFARFQEYYGELQDHQFVPFKALVDLSLYDRQRDIHQQPKILSARVMGELYRQDLLIKALPRFVSEFPDTIVTLIIGQNPSQGRPYFDQMRILAKNLKVDKYCRFIDRCLSKSEFSDQIKNHNIIYSLSTHDEGLSGTNLQSAYSGAVTIMQKSIWAKGILDDRQNVIQTLPDEQSVSDTLMYVGKHLTALQKRFLINNRTLERFDKDALMDKLTCCYQDLFN